MHWIIAAIIGFILLILKGSKGKRGEKRVASLLSHLPPEEYRVINDLLLQSGGHSTQIDHVVASTYGIFVIETKYYQGWISGGENSEYWTQNIYGNKYQLRNPLWQNESHIKAIRRLLKDEGKIPIYNIVAFSRQASLKIKRDLPVMYWRQVVPYITSFTTPVIPSRIVKDIYYTLLGANVTDKEARKAHIKSVHQKMQRRNTSVSNGRCPRCGAHLVLREGPYGQFYGCSNYPQCKYILK